MAKFKLPAISNGAMPAKPGAERCRDLEAPRASCWARIGIFVYVGAEVSIGSFLVNYMSQPYVGNIPVQIAARYVSFYWGGAMIGRFIGSGLLQKIRTGTLLGIFAIVAGTPGFALHAHARATWRCGASSRSAFSIRSCSRASSRWESTGLGR